MLFGLFLALIALCVGLFIYVPDYYSRYLKKKKINNADKKIHFFESKFQYLIGELQIDQKSDDPFKNIILDKIDKGDFDMQDENGELLKLTERITFVKASKTNTLPVEEIRCELPINNDNERKNSNVSYSELPDKPWEIFIFINYGGLISNGPIGVLKIYSINDNELESQKEYLDYIKKY